MGVNVADPIWRVMIVALPPDRGNPVMLYGTREWSKPPESGKRCHDWFRGSCGWPRRIRRLVHPVIAKQTGADPEYRSRRKSQYAYRAYLADVGALPARPLPHSRKASGVPVRRGIHRVVAIVWSQFRPAR